MTQTSRFWDGVLVGDAGPYSGDNMAVTLRNLVGAGSSKANMGIVMGSGVSPDPGLRVTATSPASANVEVSPGCALVRGTWYQNDTAIMLPIAPNSSGNTRIDTVVLEKSVVSQVVRLGVVPGTPSSTPVPATLTQNDISLWQIPIAYVTVANSFTSITNADIRNSGLYLPGADGVYLLDVYNNSGTTLNTGDIVVWDNTGDRAVTTTTLREHADVAGVWVGMTSAGGYGRMLVRGIGYVNLDSAAASRGLPIYTSTTAGKALTSRSNTVTDRSRGISIGRTLEITSASGLCLAYINVLTGGFAPAIWRVNDTGLSINLTTGTLYVDVHPNYVKTMTLKSSIVQVTVRDVVTSPGGYAPAFNVYNDQSGAYVIAGDMTRGMTATFYGLTPGSNTFRVRSRNLSGTGTGTLTQLYVVISEVAE